MIDCRGNRTVYQSPLNQRSPINNQQPFNNLPLPSPLVLAHRVSAPLPADIGAQPEDETATDKIWKVLATKNTSLTMRNTLFSP
jgi:hypothetical protein